MLDYFNFKSYLNEDISSDGQKIILDFLLQILECSRQFCHFGSEITDYFFLFAFQCSQIVAEIVQLICIFRLCEHRSNVLQKGFYR